MSEKAHTESEDELDVCTECEEEFVLDGTELCPDCRPDGQARLRAQRERIDRMYRTRRGSQ